jgi:hypothetical protein
MAKASMTNIVIIVLLLVILGVLLILAIQTPPLQTTPVEQPTPKAPWLDEQVIVIEEEPTAPTPSAPEPTEPEGIPLEKVFAQTVQFYVNNIRVGLVETYDYIPIKKSQVKTFAGTFGPYTQDPTEFIRVELCAELVDFPAKPACEVVPVLYRDGYVSFARGYKYDEYIGAQAAKDYTAYYTVYVGDTVVANGPKARIRTVND